MSSATAATIGAGRVLDTGIEAHVHDVIHLERDVELLVVEPAFDRTSMAATLNTIGERYNVPVHRHCGFRLHVSEVPDDFRGPAMPKLARRIAQDGLIDAAVIGAAAASLHRRPDLWQDYDGWAWQHLKQLWHVLVHSGKPIAAAA